MKLRNLNKTLVAPPELCDAITNSWGSLLNEKEFKDNLYNHPEFMKTFYIGDFMQFSYRPSQKNINPKTASKEMIIDPLIVFLGYFNDRIYGISLKQYMFDKKVTEGIKFIEDYVRTYFSYVDDDQEIFQRKDAYNNPAALSRFWQSIIENAKKQNQQTQTICSYVRQYSIKDFKVRNIRKLINIEDVRQEMRKAKVYKKDGVSIEEVFYE